MFEIRWYKCMVAFFLSSLPVPGTKYVKYKAYLMVALEENEVQADICLRLTIFLVTPLATRMPIQKQSSY